MKKSLKKVTAFTIAVSISASLLGGCTSSSGQASSKYTLNLGASGTSALAMPLEQLAEEKGYFAEKGLKITSTKLENAGAVMYDALSVGRIDAAYAQAVPPISYGAQGYDVTLIGGVLSGGMVAVTKPENKEELSDINNWKGHSIGVIQMSTSELTTRNALETQYGFDTTKDLKYVMIEDYPSIALSVEKGNVDIGFISSEYVESAVSEGLVVLTTLYDIKKDYVCCRQSAYSKKLEENREAYVIYLEGQIKAYKDINTDQDGTVKSLAKATGESEQFIYDYIYDTEASAHRTYNPDPNYNGVQGLYSTMLKLGYLESDLTLDQFFDLSVYADALKNVINENKGDSFYTDMKDYFISNNNEYPDFNKIYGDSFWG